MTLYLIGTGLMATAALCGAAVGMRFDTLGDRLLLLAVVFGWPVMLPFLGAVKLADAISARIARR